MGDIINLRAARKQKMRVAAETQATENRAIFGMSKVARDADRLLKTNVEKRHEGHRRENGGDAET